MDKKFIYGAAAFMCLTAVFPLPYGFYTFLRLAVSVAGVFAALELKSENNFLWVLFGGITLLFNPIFPVYLDKEVWFPIDLIVAGCFGWLVFRS
jgi:hypothetical protein